MSFFCLLLQVTMMVLAYFSTVSKIWREDPNDLAVNGTATDCFAVMQLFCVFMVTLSPPISVKVSTSPVIFTHSSVPRVSEVLNEVEFSLCCTDTPLTDIVEVRHLHYLIWHSHGGPLTDTFSGQYVRHWQCTS